MNQLLDRRVTVAWLALVAATLISLWVGTDHGEDGARAAGVGLVVVAFVKIRIIGMHFMDLREAPLPLRLLFESWCALVCAGIIVAYLIA